MDKFTFTNSRNEAVTFFGSPFHLYNAEGLGDVKADIATQKAPYQDGGTFIAATLQPRYVTLQFRITTTDYTDVLDKRQDLARVCNPKLGLGVLRYETGDFVREIQAVADGVPIYPGARAERGDGWQKGSVTFMCPSPYWQTITQEEKPIFEPRFHFPVSAPFIMGIQRTERIITNDGDVAAPLLIDFYGPATNPKITNKTTGEFIKVNQTLQAGEVMKIDTSDNEKSVIFVAADGTTRNVFNWIDLNSTFFKLIIGDNLIEYTADSDVQNAVVNIRYKKGYNTV